VTAWHVAQLVLTAVALAQLVRTARAIVWTAPCDVRALCDSVGVALLGQQRDLAVALIAASRPAWAAQLLELALDPTEQDSPREAMDELRSSLVGRQADRLSTLGSLGRMAGPLAFLAIVLELSAAFSPGHGLLALQRGLVQSIAIQHAALSFAIGLATTVACTASATFMRERLRGLSDDLTRTREAMIKALEPEPDM
jgi:hypothetical protein